MYSVKIINSTEMSLLFDITRVHPSSFAENFLNPVKKKIVVYILFPFTEEYEMCAGKFKIF